MCLSIQNCYKENETHWYSTFLSRYVIITSTKRLNAWLVSQSVGVDFVNSTMLTKRLLVASERKQYDIYYACILAHSTTNPYNRPVGFLMDGVLSSEDGNEQKPTTLPLTPEMIGTITGIEPSMLKSDHLRKIRRLLHGMISGCVVIVVENEMIESVYKVQKFIIGPAE